MIKDLGVAVDSLVMLLICYLSMIYVNLLRYKKARFGLARDNYQVSEITTV
jgi:hypothetical protein